MTYAEITSLLMRYQSVKDKSIRTISNFNALDEQVSAINNSILTNTNKVSDLTSSKVLLDNSLNVFRTLLDRLSQEHINQLTTLLTNALQTIFFDRDYRVEVEVLDKRSSKTLNFFLIETLETGEIIKSPFQDSIGGGILAVIGFILQVFYLSFLNKSPIIFIDEGFSQVSTQYIPYLMSFINELSITKSFIMVLISHDPRLNPYSNNTYHVNRGTVKKVSKSTTNTKELTNE